MQGTRAFDFRHARSRAIRVFFALSRALSLSLCRALELALSQFVFLIALGRRRDGEEDDQENKREVSRRRRSLGAPRRESPRRRRRRAQPGLQTRRNFESSARGCINEIVKIRLQCARRDLSLFVHSKR